MKYRKKPVEVDAIRCWSGEDSSNISECLKFCGKDNLELTEDFFEGGLSLVVPTLEGNMKVNDGDWIIKTVTGQLYPCKPDIFEKTFEKVEEI